MAPPVPQGISVDLGASALVLPLVDIAGLPVPDLPPPPPEEPDDAGDDDSHVRWWTERDVLARTTRAHVDHGASYDAPHGARCTEHYVGMVEVRDDDWRQQAAASTRFEVVWPEVTAAAVSTLELVADADAFDVTLTLAVSEDGAPVHERTWHERLPRDLG